MSQQIRPGDIFRTGPDRRRGSTSLLYNGYSSFSGVMRPERGVNHPSPPSAEVKETAELYFYPPSVPSTQLIGWTLLFFVAICVSNIWGYPRSHTAWFVTVIPTRPSRLKKAENVLESSWIVMAHGDAREGKWRGNWRMECVASTLYTTSEHGVSSITTADAHTSAASSRLNWRPPSI
jgi:hypothetical protein